MASKNNDKLIRAGDLFKAVCDDAAIRGPAFAAIRRHIDAAPAVEAKEVVHGRWKFDTDGDPYCSVCRKYAGLLRIESGNYCPDCGAKMDGGNDK